MKISSILLLTFSFVLLNISEILADDAEFRLIELRNDQKILGEYHIGIQIRVLSGTYPRTLNSFTADIYYGSKLAPFINKPDTNWSLGNEYSCYVQKLSGYYRVLVVSLNVNSAGNSKPPGNPPGWEVSNTWQTILTLRWIISTLGQDYITINDNTNAAAYYKNFNNAPQGELVEWTVYNQDLEIETPVELSFFRANFKENLVELTWQTATELNNYGFEIERRMDSGDLEAGKWKVVGFVKGNINSTVPINYSFEDNNLTGIRNLFYRLKQIDLNGLYEYSNEIEVSLVPDQFKLFQNYPNPFNPETKIKFALPIFSNVNLRVYNLMGENVVTLVEDFLDAGYYEIPFSANNLSSGVYFYRIQSGNYSETKRMILIK